jgi:coenzyme F420-reducing hydrogenase delta subunit
MESVGIDPKRLEIGFASSSEGQKFATMMTDFVMQIEKLGPSPSKRKPRSEKLVQDSVKT